MASLNVSKVKVYTGEVVMRGFLNTHKNDEDRTPLEEKHHNIRCQHVGFSLSFYFWATQKDGTPRPYAAVSQKSHPASPFWDMGFLPMKVLETSDTQISGVFNVGGKEVGFKVAVESQEGRSLEGRTYEYHTVTLARSLTIEECRQAIEATKQWNEDNPVVDGIRQYAVAKKTGVSPLTTGDDAEEEVASTASAEIPF